LDPRLNPELILYEILEGNMTLDMVDSIDSSLWTEDYLLLLKTLREMMACNKEMSMENVFTTSKRKDLLAKCIDILNKYDLKKER